jgi:hypothetical protein
VSPFLRARLASRPPPCPSSDSSSDSPAVASAREHAAPGNETIGCTQFGKKGQDTHQVKDLMGSNEKKSFIKGKVGNVAERR